MVFDNVLLEEKSYKTYKNILIYDISYKTFMGAKPLRIRFNKIDEFIKIYGGIRYLVLYDYKRYNTINDRIRYLISEKSSITDSVNHNFARIKIDSYNYLPLEKLLTFFKSVVKNNKNEYFYIFLETGSYKDKSNTQYFYMNVCML